jgi:hypothetical protein
MGIIDLLWPLVLLQLRGQSLMCPGWKFSGWITKALKQLEQFSKEIRKKIPSKSVCPTLSKHEKEILNKKYGKSTLEDGWYLIGKENPMDLGAVQNKDEKMDDENQTEDSEK